MSPTFIATNKDIDLLEKTYKFVLWIVELDSQQKNWKTLVRPWTLNCASFDQPTKCRHSEIVFEWHENGADINSRFYGVIWKIDIRR